MLSCTHAKTSKLLPGELDKQQTHKHTILVLTSLWLSCGEFQSLLSFLNAGWAVSIRLYTVPVAALVTDLMEARVRLSLSSSLTQPPLLCTEQRVVDYNGGVNFSFSLEKNYTQDICGENISHYSLKCCPQ